MSLRSGTIFITHILSPDIYLGKVINIYGSENTDLWIAYETFRTVEFNEDLVSYQIEKCSDLPIKFLKLTELTIDRVFKIHKYDDKEFILLMKVNSI